MKMELTDALTQHVGVRIDAPDASSSKMSYFGNFIGINRI